MPGDRKVIGIIVEYSNGERKTPTVDAEKPAEKHAQRTIYFLNELQTGAKQNLKLKKETFRYDTEIKMIASFLRMICGPYAYETIQRNLEGALPSIVSTNRYINTSRCKVAEGVLRCKELLEYLHERNLPFAVCLSEDATRITGCI